MALTAREWLLLPKTEQEKRRKELSPEECFKLRTKLSMIHFTEEQKVSMSEEDKYRFTHPRESNFEKKENFNNEAENIFQKMIKESKMENAIKKD